MTRSAWLAMRRSWVASRTPGLPGGRIEIVDQAPPVGEFVSVVVAGDRPIPAVSVFDEVVVQAARIGNDPDRRGRGVDQVGDAVWQPSAEVVGRRFGRAVVKMAVAVEFAFYAVGMNGERRRGPGHCQHQHEE